MAGVLRDVNNPVVFFEITIGKPLLPLSEALILPPGGFPAGKIEIELFADVCPKVNSLSRPKLIFNRPQKTSVSYVLASSSKQTPLI